MATGNHQENMQIDDSDSSFRSNTSTVSGRVQSPDRDVDMQNGEVPASSFKRFFEIVTSALKGAVDNLNHRCDSVQPLTHNQLQGYDQATHTLLTRSKAWATVMDELKAAGDQDFLEECLGTVLEAGYLILEIVPSEPDLFACHSYVNLCEAIQALTQDQEFKAALQVSARILHIRELGENLRSNLGATDSPIQEANQRLEETYKENHASLEAAHKALKAAVKGPSAEPPKKDTTSRKR